MKVLAQFFCLFLLLPLVSFRSPSPKNQGDYVIYVAVGYGKMDCNGLTVKKVLGYNQSTFNPNQVNTGGNAVQRIVANYYNIPLEDVQLYAGYGKRYAAIISYNAEVSGWGCQVNTYSVGFGNTSEDALSDAIRIKRSIAPSASHSLVRYVYAE